jgi:UDP-N-acetyl-D-galactosamine dehydrogenase
MSLKQIQVVGAKVLVMGLAFKENCPDVRNTKVIDIVRELREYGCEVDIFDPWVPNEYEDIEHGITMTTELKSSDYDAIMLAVAHDQFKVMGGAGVRKLAKQKCFIYDIKNIIDKSDADLRL